MSTESNILRVWKNIRKILRVKYGKPYVLDKRKPENAEEILKKD